MSEDEADDYETLRRYGAIRDTRFARQKRITSNARCEETETRKSERERDEDAVEEGARGESAALSILGRK